MSRWGFFLLYFLHEGYFQFMFYCISFCFYFLCYKVKLDNAFIYFFYFFYEGTPLFTIFLPLIPIYILFTWDYFAIYNKAISRIWTYLCLLSANVLFAVYLPIFWVGFAVNATFLSYNLFSLLAAKALYIFCIYILVAWLLLLLPFFCLYSIILLIDLICCGYDVCYKLPLTSILTL